MDKSSSCKTKVETSWNMSSKSTSGEAGRCSGEVGKAGKYALYALACDDGASGFVGARIVLSVDGGKSRRKNRKRPAQPIGRLRQSGTQTSAVGEGRAQTAKRRERLRVSVRARRLRNAHRSTMAGKAKKKKKKGYHRRASPHKENRQEGVKEKRAGAETCGPVPERTHT